MRGNRIGLAGPDTFSRSIPAHAGEPAARASASTSVGVYPRACGGTAQTCAGGHPDQGLSPRMRGNRLANARGAGELGSIPAHAGEPGAAVVAALAAGVYPRACGGTRKTPTAVWSGEGLSPRMRGNHFGSVTGLPWQGSIPAHAGEPPPCCRPSSRRWVYPRACGGTIGLVTGCDSFEKGVNRVYPRACGGTGATVFAWSPPAGLSPRMRGNLRARRHRELNIGSIPAHAGEPT